MPLIQSTLPSKIFGRIMLFLCICFFFCFSTNAQTSPLFDAVKNNDLSTLKSLLDKKINANVYDDDSDHILMYAAFYASADCMELLINNGANVNAVNKTLETPLMWCNHDLQKTKLLLQHGANVNAIAASGNTALLVACVGAGQYEIVKFLLDNGADPFAINNKGQTALFRTATFGDTATARMLVNKGIDINAKTLNKETAMETATVNENKEMLYWLLNNGASPNISDAYDALPLTYAGVFNDENVVKALLEKTTDLNCLDIDGITPLMWACFNEHSNPGIIKLLLAKGALVNLRDKKGQTALGWALKKGNTETVAILKKAGAQQ